MIYHGDCLEILKTLPDNSVDLVLTDPPYGIDYQSAWRTDKTQWKPKIANDKKPFIWWLPEAYRVLKEGGAMLCFTRYDTENDFRWAMNIAGFIPKMQVIWDKGVHGMGDLKGDFAPLHENIIFATKGRFIFPGKRPKSVIRCQRVSPEKLIHPNEKPVELLKEIIEATTTEGQTVLDAFLGSGATALAAYETRRSFIGIEMSEEYVKIAEARIASVKYQTAIV